MTHDYERNGTTTLFAALDIATGKSSANAARIINLALCVTNRDRFCSSQGGNPRFAQRRALRTVNYAAEIARDGKINNYWRRTGRTHEERPVYL